ncbi:MAG: endo alpha-1,4 polygalactosaminidase, partial [Oscillospiraceae bacterium]|nr:endo alpha-1,4 polygalactosaminidase [Oscillospiraceae bacterium]
MKTGHVLIALAAALLLAGCAAREGDGGEVHDYGVFLSYEGSLSALNAYNNIVIDAQYYSREDIAEFRKNGHTVYSYLNVGSLESFRDYWSEYEELALGAYEHWDEEVWMDVSSPRWQAFLLDTLAQELREKGVDGFFVDNCDVYYFYPDSGIFDGLSTILRALRADGTPVIINGGDAFLDAWCERGGAAPDVASGVNQESVFTAIDWD